MQLITLLGAAVAMSGLANAAPRTFEERAGAAAKRRDYTHKSGYRSRQGLSNAGSTVEDGASKAATSWTDPDDCGLPGGVVTVTQTISFTVSPDPPATQKPHHHGHSWSNAPGSQEAPTGTESPDAPGTVTATATESESPWAPGTVTAIETATESPQGPTTIVTATATLSKTWGQGHHPHQHHTWSRPAFNTTITLSYNTTATMANSTSTSEPCPDETKKPHKTWPVRNTTAIITSTVSLANATTPAASKPCNETGSQHWWPKPTSSPLLNTTNATTSTPCPEDEMTSTTILPTTTTDCPEEEMTSTSAAPTTSTPDCPEDEMTSTSSSTSSSTFSSAWANATHPGQPPSHDREPCGCEDDYSYSTTATATDPATVSASTSPAAATATSTTAVQNLTITATSAASTWTTSTTTCVIDTSVTPVTTAAANVTLVRPTSTVVPTTTVCATDAPTGTPQTASTHCGVHGLPVGDYFLARFVENSADVPVTLEGCYQFCSSVWGDTHGCLSYDFYLEDGLGVPRCDLYGSSVAYALASIDNNEPHTWFDLACGDPTSSEWSHISS